MFLPSASVKFQSRLTTNPPRARLLHAVLPDGRFVLFAFHAHGLFWLEEEKLPGVG